MRRCAVAGCERPWRAKGYCNPHYLRWYRTGNPGDADIREYGHESCHVEGCERPYRSSGYCATHHKRVQRTGHPGTADVRGPAESYVGIHLKVARERGPASEQRCEHCEETADDWAYDHSDPEELYRPEYGSPYSLDTARYLPLCRTCHIKFDDSSRQPA